MTEKYKYQKIRIILIIVFSLFVFVSLIGLVIYEKQKSHIIDAENQKIETEIELLGDFLSDSILKSDYSEAKNFLNSWQKKKEELRDLEVIFENGKKLFVYNKECVNKLGMKKIFTISNKKYSIYLSNSMQQFEKHLNELKFILIFTVIAFSFIVGFALWFVLTSWILKPLQEEINNKTVDLNKQKILLEKINTSYVSLSQSNLALLEAKDEQELLNNVCKIVHDYSNYELVWIGYKNNDKDKTVTVHASSGIKNSYLKDINIFWSDCPRGNGPTGKSIRLEKTIVINDIANDKTFEPWKEEALKREFLSSISIPIIYDDVVLGAMSIYSDKVNAFFNEEVKLLNKLVSNLAFGIISLRQRTKIEKNSVTDGLTDIYNRRYFDKVFPEFVQLAKRNDNLNLVCFVILDIDHFKQYNDTYGHQKGDEVLISVAKFLHNSLKRPDDKCFRLGGEEFGILFNATSKENAALFANHIKNGIEKLCIKHEHNSASPYITASFGLICQQANDITNVDKLYKQADDLMYKSKENGRNQVSIA